MNPHAIQKHVDARRSLRTEKAKQGYLQDLIGPPSNDQDTLHFRALLITALNQAEVWPHRREREEAA